jgi:hypothetical protein
MAVNNRIFYACQMVGISAMGVTNDILEAHGVQSIGITTNFNLEQAFELGQIQIYENIEGLPDVEVSMEKVLDGYPLLYHMCTSGATNASLVGRSKARTDIRLGIYSDDQDFVSGTPEIEVYCSGMFIGSVSYTIPVDGNATEAVTLVGNNKQWLSGANTRYLSGSHTVNISGVDEPKAYRVTTGGGVQRREDVMLASSILPSSIVGVRNAVGQTGNGVLSSTDDTPLVHIQNVSISTDFSREDILELGKKTPYFRAPGFPIEVTCDIEAITISGDFVSVYEDGNPDFSSTKDAGDNVADERIVIMLRDETKFDLGTKNKLSSVSYGGGDATGGNVSCAYSYQNFNVFKVQHREDPMGAYS